MEESEEACSDFVVVIVRPVLEGRAGEESKFRAAKSLRVAQLLPRLRRSVRVGPDMALYLYHQNRLLALNRMLGDVFDDRAEPEACLRLELHTMPVFGAHE